MSFEVYLGNYPSSFTPEDLSHMFSVFKGSKVLRSIIKKKKCFSFVECVDQQQVVDVVLTLHDTFVHGRNLVVRAVDQDLQDGIEEFMYNKFLDDEKTVQSELKKLYPVLQQDAHPYDPGSQFRQMDEKELLNLNIPITNPEKNFPYHPKSEGNAHFGQSENELSNDTSANLDFECNKTEKVFCHLPKKVSPQSDSGQLRSSYSHLDTHPNVEGTFCDHECYVSVFNFPYYSTISKIHKLFSDFHPVHVSMVCNKEQSDGRPTEAVVVFKSKEEATDAILNYDNTYYCKRLLLVTDADTELVTELLRLGKD